MNDHFGNDDVYFRINGNAFQNKIQMRTGDKMQFGPRFHYDFSNEAVVELWEAEWGEHDDHLGTFTVHIKELDTGEHTVILTHSERGKYEFTYRVEPIPAKQ